MKRQRNMAGSAMKAQKYEDDRQDAKVVMMKKKKRAQKLKEEEGKVEEERRRDGGGEPAAVAPATEIQRNWEEWPWMTGMVDEQMSWGSTWLPYWGVEFLGEAYNVLYGDVIWDYDIWDLKAITEVPSNP